MGKSHQTGWVSLRGKRWFGYFRQTVLDPETNEERVQESLRQTRPQIKNDQGRSA